MAITIIHYHQYTHKVGVTLEEYLKLKEENPYTECISTFIKRNKNGSTERMYHTGQYETRVLRIEQPVTREFAR